MDSVSLEAIIEQFVAENAEKLKAGMTKKDFKVELNAMITQAGLPEIKSQDSVKETIIGFSDKLGYKFIQKKGNKWGIDVVTNEVESVNSDIKTDSELIEESLHVKLDLSKDSSKRDIYAAFSLFVMNEDGLERYFIGNHPQYFKDIIKQWLSEHSVFARDLIARCRINLKQIPKADIIKRFYKDKSDNIKTLFETSFNFDEFVTVFGEVIEAITPNHPKWIEAYNEGEKREEERQKQLRAVRERESMKRAEFEQKRLAEEQKRYEEELQRERELAEKKAALYSELNKYGFANEEIDSYTPTDLENIANLNIFEIDCLRRIDDKIASGSKLNAYDFQLLVDVARRRYNIDSIIYKKRKYVDYKEDRVIRYVMNRIIHDHLLNAINKFIGSEDIIKPYKKYYETDFRQYHEELKTETTINLDDFAIYELITGKLKELYWKLLEIDRNDHDLLDVKRYAEDNLTNHDIKGYIRSAEGEAFVNPYKFVIEHYERRI